MALEDLLTQVSYQLSRIGDFLGPASVHILRDGVFLGNYNTGAADNDERGDSLVTAIGELEDGDILITGPGNFHLDADAIDITNEIYWQAYWSILSPASDNSSYSYLTRLSHDNIIVDGVIYDGLNQANAGTGNGLLINYSYNNCLIRNVLAKRLEGSTSTRGRGIYVQSDGHIVEGCRSIENNYCGLRASNCASLTIRNCWFGNNGNRSIEIDGSLVTDSSYVHIENTTCIVDDGALGLQAIVNFNNNFQYNKIVLDNVKIIDDDQLSNMAGTAYGDGISFDAASRFQSFKIGNSGNAADLLIFNNCEFRHGANDDAGGTAYGIAFDVAPQITIIKGCTFSGGISGLGPPRFERMKVADTEFGVDDINETTLISYLPIGKVSYEDCTFNLGTTATQVWSIGSGSSGSIQDSDSIVILDCDFNGDNDSTDLVLFTNEGDEDLLSDPRKVICSGVQLTNVGTQDFLLSDDSNIYLLLNTDRNGDMLYVASDGNMPSPGAGPYFTSVPGIQGQKIWNVEWDDIGTDQIQYWWYNGTNWIAGHTL